MLGIVLVTHGKLGEALLEAAEVIVGPIEAARALTLHPSDQVEALRERMTKAIAEVDSGDGTLILTDMFGGTPANIGLSFLNEREVEVVTGVNLPMLLKLNTARTESLALEEAAKLITAYGQKNIVVASALLSAQRTER